MAPDETAVIKNFKRLLSATEKLQDSNSIEEWKLDQFVIRLNDMLNEMKRSRPSDDRLEEWRNRIDILQKKINPLKLDEQTFPRQIQRQLQSQLPTTQVQNEIQSDNDSRSNVILNERLTIQSPIVEEKTEIKKNRWNSDYGGTSNVIENHIKHEENEQEKLAEIMSLRAIKLKSNAIRLQDIVKGDKEKLNEVEGLVDRNVAKLSVQGKRLKHNAYQASNCWIYIMLVLVIGTFISMTLFMRMFRKKTYTIVHKTIMTTKTTTLAKTVETLSQANVRTKENDYISFLMNYANENHTDL